MKRYIVLFIYVVLGANAFAQGANSWDGVWLSPHDTVRSLNVFVNIIYDVNPSLNPVSSDGFWPYTTTEGINSSEPSYLTDFVDMEYTGADNVHGTMTRLYHESSFGSLVLLGDIVVVNIKHATINASGGTFSYTTLKNAVIVFINSKGFDTIGNHNAIADYDSDGDNNMDLLQFIIRNSTKSYGGEDIGNGHVTPNSSDLTSLVIGGISCGIQNHSYQAIGSGNLSAKYKSIVYHEISHCFFGGNSFHTSGGNHYGTPDVTTFMGLQGGYGLMGNSGSGLISCNGYERWRMNWMHNDNTTGNPISSINQSTGKLEVSDIDNSSGSVSFLLRDFVTYGDAIRIKLPYKETSDASNQYLWLENHQVGRNGALDFFQYGEKDCIPMGTPGIYSCIQVGKDARTPAEGNVWPRDETDNLLIVSAEGNWDIEYVGQKNDCLNWGSRSIGKYNLPNPFCGENDQSQFFYSTTASTLSASGNDDRSAGVKIDQHDIEDKALPYLGDSKDAFTDGSVMDIGTNPAPVNTLTYYVRQSGGNIVPQITNRNNRTIYLTGLSITMTESGSNESGKIFRVDINWGEYDVKNDVRWTGNIELREELNLLSGNTILLDQNYTPIQRDRDVVTGEFSEKTTFTCADGSSVTLQENSKMIVDNMSELVLENGSSFEIKDGAELIIKDKGNLEVQDGASLVLIGTGRVIVD